ncbi:MAG: hypothetical protein IT329_23920 [Caldilineaceae bacterium]|nr:hypothetical protein [Caldilineaceae bacterium]
MFDLLALPARPDLLTIVGLATLGCAVFVFVATFRRGQPSRPSDAPVPHSPEAPRRAAVTYTALTGKQRKAIRRQAQLDYERARGSAHRKLLEETRRQLEQKQAQIDAEMQRIRQQLQALEAQYQADLRTALELHFVRDRFDQVPGIGSALKARILSATNARRLADLAAADTVVGVGESRMAAITAWIADARRQMPTLLAQPFPGRGPIDQRFHEQKSSLQHALAQCQTRSASLHRRMAALDQHLNALKTVTPQTFVEAASGSQTAQQAALHYTAGLFAEWEPVPGWFREIVEGRAA